MPDDQPVFTNDQNISKADLEAARRVLVPMMEGIVAGYRDYAGVSFTGFQVAAALEQYSWQVLEAFAAAIDEEETPDAG